jgi:hypothetical protein
MRALQFITDHVIFKLRYNQIYQMKTTLRCLLFEHLISIPVRARALYWTNHNTAH